MLKCVTALLILLALGQPAHAFWVDGNCQSGSNPNAASYTPSLPANGNTGDILVLIGVAERGTDMSIANAGWTPFTGYTTGGSNVSPDAGNNLPWASSGQGKVAVWWAPQGSAPPTVTFASGNTGRFGYSMCAYYGVDATTPITAGAAVATSSSANVTFPSLTPSAANQELLLTGIGLFGGSATVSKLNPVTTCGVNTGQVTHRGQLVNSNQPIMFNYLVNQGPCAPAATTSGVLQIASTSGNNIGLALLLKSRAIAPLRHPMGAALYHNEAGLSRSQTAV
jgi:hypothetical protein